MPAPMTTPPKLPTHCTLCTRRLKPGDLFEAVLAYDEDDRVVNLAVHVLCRIELTAQRVALHLDDDVEQDDPDDYLDEVLAEVLAKKVKRMVRDSLRRD